MVGDDRQGSHPDEWTLRPPDADPDLSALRGGAAGARRPTPAAHQRHLGALCASLAAVAATHPNAWFRDGKSAEQIATVTAANRMVAYPYPKFMTSIIDVDQAAAVVMTSAARRARSGFRRRDGCTCTAPARRTTSGTSRIASTTLVARHGGGLSSGARAGGRWSRRARRYVDLYSCFPVAVQIGARVLGFPTDGTRALTVTGGLPYFGGAGNNYALHAIATMVERLRERPGVSGWCRRSAGT